MRPATGGTATHLALLDLQGTGGTGKLEDRQLKELLRLGGGGVRRVITLQRRMLGDSGLLPLPPAADK